MGECFGFWCFENEQREGRRGEGEAHPLVLALELLGSDEAYPYAVAHEGARRRTFRDLELWCARGLMRSADLIKEERGGGEEGRRVGGRRKPQGVWRNQEEWHGARRWKGGCWGRSCVKIREVNLWEGGGFKKNPVPGPSRVGERRRKGSIWRSNTSPLGIYIRRTVDRGRLEHPPLTCLPLYLSLPPRTTGSIPPSKPSTKGGTKENIPIDAMRFLRRSSFIISLPAITSSPFLTIQQDPPDGRPRWWQLSDRS